jgi:hypothetical protein
MNPWDTTISDRIAYFLAAASALSGAVSGILSFGDNPCAAVLTIVAGTTAGAGIFFSVESSRKRDELLANALHWTANPPENSAGFG